MRLHARVNGPWTLTGAARPQARLHGFRVTRRGLEALPGSPLAARVQPAMLSNERLPVRRARDDAAYEFRLPMSWTDGGIKLVGEVSPPGVAGSLTECARCRADNPTSCR